MNSIEEIIKLGQNESIEFLPEINDLVDLAKVCAAFANRNGGSVFIGVNEKGKLIGVNPDPELKLIQEIHEFIDGELKVKIITHTVKHYYLIEIKISQSGIPILVKPIDGVKVFYYRVGKNTVEANKIMERYLNLRKFRNLINESNNHKELLLKLDERQLNLSSLYKLIDLKPKEIDKIIAELLYLGKLEIQLKDNFFYYSRCKM